MAAPTATDHRTEEQRFNAMKDLSTQEFVVRNSHNNPKAVQIIGYGGGVTFVNIEQARQLRDWLNMALPKDAT